jgi:hypothetical protein
MAIMPMKQSVTVSRKGEVDRWGNQINTVPPFTLKCRFEEGVKLTRKTSSQQAGTNAITSEEVISTAQVYFDKFADIRLTDELIYTDESGNTRTYLPLNVNRLSGLNGKAMLTVVHV